MPNSQLLEILLAAMVAGVLLFRLYTILGRRTGQEPQPQNPRLPNPLKPVPAPVAAPAERPAQAQAGGLFDIQLADPAFETGHFLKGARAAYEIILKAFVGGDRATLKPLLSGEVYAAFDQAIAQRHDAPAVEHLAGITDARIAHAALAGNAAEITVAFRAQFANGDAQRDVNDVWTFARSIGAATPNWTLVATGGELP
jgi:predicted lipid-binding transport protein (Tim44 family)